jgi:hypothetical protein
VNHGRGTNSNLTAMRYVTKATAMPTAVNVKQVAARGS